MTAAKPIGDPVGMVTGTLLAATSEAGEPADLSNGSSQFPACPADRSVWYRWTAPAKETAIFTIEGAFGVAAYSGTQLGDLMPLATKGSEYPFRAVTILFNILPGDLYYILVANCSTVVDHQAFTLSWTFSGAGPVNDNFASAEEITGDSGTGPGSTVGATIEIGEPQIDTIVGPPDRSLWYHWTAPSSGPWVFTTDGAYVENGGYPIDSVLGVYSGGNNFATLEVVANNDDFFTYDRRSRFSTAVFNAEAGKQYWIAVSGLRGQEGLFRLNWAPVPQNDHFADASNISGVSGEVKGTNLGASWETGDPDPGDWGASALLFDRSVWYRWTAPTTGRWTFNTLGSNFNTAIGVYTLSGGTSSSDLIQVATDNDTYNPRCDSSATVYTGIVAFDAEAGVDYYLAVDSGQSGNTGSAISLTLGGFFTLKWKPAPQNDQFTSAQEINGEVGMVAGSTEAATMETGELASILSPGAAPQDFGHGASVWFRWQAPHSVMATFDTLGNNAGRPAAIEVRTGATPDDLSLVAYIGTTPCSGSEQLGAVSFQASQGQTYRISVATRFADAGPIVLNWSAPAPTATATSTPSATNTPTFTHTPTVTASRTPTATLAPTPTATGFPTGTAKATATPTPTQTARHTATPTHSSTPTTSVTSTATPLGVCAGDCGANHTVDVANLILLVNIALGNGDAATCPHGILAGTAVDISFIVRAVNNALTGCPAT